MFPDEPVALGSSPPLLKSGAFTLIGKLQLGFQVTSDERLCHLDTLGKKTKYIILHKPADIWSILCIIAWRDGGNLKKQCLEGRFSGRTGRGRPKARRTDSIRAQTNALDEETWREFISWTNMDGERPNELKHVREREPTFASCNQGDVIQPQSGN